MSNKTTSVYSSYPDNIDWMVTYTVDEEFKIMICKLEMRSTMYLKTGTFNLTSISYHNTFPIIVASELWLL